MIATTSTRCHQLYRCGQRCGHRRRHSIATRLVPTDLHTLKPLPHGGGVGVHGKMLESEKWHLLSSCWLDPVGGVKGQHPGQ